MNAKQVKKIRQELRAQGMDITQGQGRTSYRKAKDAQRDLEITALTQPKAVHHKIGVPSAGKASNFKGFRNVEQKPWRADTNVLVADYSLSEEKKANRASNLRIKRARARGHV